MTFIYRTTGQLIERLASDHVDLAREYLQEPVMAQYLPDELQGIIQQVEWFLDNNGLHYKVEAVAHRKLTPQELTELGDWVRGQNSDGLGEGFEQQDFGMPFDWTSNPSTFTLLGEGDSAPAASTVDSLEEVVARAIKTLMELGSFDGAHHKQYALDQTLRVLTECPTVLVEANDYNGVSYSYEALGESATYQKAVTDFEAGEEGPNTYEWDAGIAP